MKPINTEQFSATLRGKAIDVTAEKLLLTNFKGSQQEEDFSEPANCDGFGRIRHFRRASSDGWPSNPLPIDPAAHALGIPRPEILKAQVFQNAVCNWRCWYCFVPFNLLSGNSDHSSWMSAADILDLYQKEEQPPRMIDLTGGQPDLTPEWIPWMMRELQRRGLSETVYLWSDDNLSNDYFWKFLSPDDISLVRSFKNYGKVCCFKGFNRESFSFNTNADPELYDGQFELFRRYHELGLDLYAYSTFTTPNGDDPSADMAEFVDRLQGISLNLPLRVIPLEIRMFTPMKDRKLTDNHDRAVEFQWNAIRCWNLELEKRFSSALRSLSVYEVPL